MLSILMPVYNERERVEQAIAEVLDTQLPTEFELIVAPEMFLMSEPIRSGSRVPLPRNCRRNASTFAGSGSYTHVRVPPAPTSPSHIP